MSAKNWLDFTNAGATLPSGLELAVNVAEPRALLRANAEWLRRAHPEKSYVVRFHGRTFPIEHFLKPCAFLVTGPERLSQVIAEARTVGAIGLAFALEKHSTVDDIATALRSRIMGLRAYIEAGNAPEMSGLLRVEIGLAWRAYRAALAEEHVR